MPSIGDLLKGIMRSPPRVSAPTTRLLESAAEAPVLDMAAVEQLKNQLKKAPSGPQAMIAARRAGLQPILPEQEGVLAKEIADIIKQTPDVPLPMFGERYPAKGPPVLAPKDDGPGFYLGKGPSLEAALVDRRRKAAQKIINRGEYDRRFDPNQRYDVDPYYYEPQQSTQDLIMQKLDARARHERNLNDPEKRAAIDARLDRAYEHGVSLDNRGYGAQRWYPMGQYEAAYKEMYGPELGRRVFLRDFPEAMAATTGGAAPQGNFLMGSYGNFMRERGSLVPTASWDLPYPIGGRYAEGNLETYNKLINQGGGFGLDNPKRYDFLNAFLGNKKSPVIDEQMMDIILPNNKLKAPPEPGYGLYQEPVIAAAGRAGVDPIEFQGTGWSGAKNLKIPSYNPQPMIEHPNEAIERMARVTGMSRDEALQQMLRRGVVYGTAGTAGLGAALGGAVEQPPQYQ